MSSSIPVLTRPKLLLVDDVRANLLLLAKALQEYDCRLATDGASALERAFADPPDLILLDVLMPGLDGYEVCRRLKADPRTMDIPVIFLTNLSDEKDEKVGLEAGAIDYIAKPFRLPIVKARVRNHLELKRRGDLLEELASLDSLGIPNRRSFDKRLATEWNRAKRHGTSLALIWLDTDFFKAYNERYGHPQGDACLRKVVSALKAVPRRASDFLARWGGDEFMAILADTSLDEAMNMAEKMRSRVAELAIPHESSKIAPYVTISLGVAARVPGDNDSAAALEKDADDALYRAKDAGRNCVAC